MGSYILGARLIPGTFLGGKMVQETHVKQPDEIYCSSCGAVIKREAELCVHCGVRVRPALEQGGAKSKVAAILLAVFLSFWTWLYTYREDGWKFWVGLGVSIGNFVLSMATLGIWLLVAIPSGLGIWIWSIVDTAVKDDDWYASY
jgi:hypothetical protein